MRTVEMDGVPGVEVWVILWAVGEDAARGVGGPVSECNVQIHKIITQIMMHPFDEPRPVCARA